MVSCIINPCQEEVYYMCFCSGSMRFICRQHLEIHLKTPFQHEISILEANHSPSSLSYMCRTLKDSHEAMLKLKSHIEDSKNKLKSALRKIDFILISIDERCQQINYLLDILEFESNPNSYASENLKTYRRISEEKISKIMKKVSIPENEPLNLPDFNLSSWNEFFNIIENIIRPVVTGGLPKQFEILAPPEFKIDISPSACKYYTGTMNHNEEVTIKLYEILETTNQQLESHLKFSSNPAFLSVKEHFKKLNKLHIVTEPWTHTLWNELVTRKYEEAFFNQTRLLNIYEELLKAFQDEDQHLFITPNIIHVTKNGEWKIWYPPIVGKGVKKYPYSSPEACGSKSFNYPLSNLFSLGLVILELATLKDTSKMYKKKNVKVLEELVMKVTDSNLRKALIMVVLQKPNVRINYPQVIKIIESSRLA